jgi:N-dimethylarginine dimethylaminohydrolase
MVLDETNLMGNRHLRDVLRAKGYDVTTARSAAVMTMSTGVRCWPTG